MSFLEMLDVLNEDLEKKGEAPVAFEHDCREGICGSCGFLIDGGHMADTAVHDLPAFDALLQGRRFAELEPWRAKAFPVLRDLVVALRIRPHHSGRRFHYRAHRQRSGHKRDPGPRGAAETAFDAAACIGCGACVAACPNASAMLFTSAKQW